MQHVCAVIYWPLAQCDDDVCTVHGAVLTLNHSSHWSILCWASAVSKYLVQ